MGRPNRASTRFFSRTKKKLFFSCFSSSIYRIRIACELARQHGRKVAIVGRSMLESSEIAQDLGYLDLPSSLIIHPGQINDYSPSRSWSSSAAPRASP